MEKIQGMVKQMIKKLLTEAAEEQSHKQWCDAELERSQKQNDDYNLKHDKLAGYVDELSAKAATIVKKLKDLSVSLSELEQGVKTATETRKKEHQDFEASAKEGQTAQLAIKQAMKVLTDYKAERDEKAQRAAALQEQARPAPLDLVLLQRGRAVQEMDGGMGILDEQPSDPAQGSQGRQADRGSVAGSIVDMLGIALSDFQKAQTEQEQGEAAAQREYEAYLQSCEVEKATLVTSLGHLQTDQAETAKKLADLSEDKRQVAEQLAESSKYLEGLKVSCGPQKITFEDRQARRKRQIDALRNALSSLEAQAEAA